MKGEGVWIHSESTVNHNALWVNNHNKTQGDVAKPQSTMNKVHLDDLFNFGCGYDFSVPFFRSVKGPEASAHVRITFCACSYLPLRYVKKKSVVSLSSHFSLSIVNDNSLKFYQWNVYTASAYKPFDLSQFHWDVNLDFLEEFIQSYFELCTVSEFCLVVHRWGLATWDKNATICTIFLKSSKLGGVFVLQ